MGNAKAKIYTLMYQLKLLIYKYCFILFLFFFANRLKNEVQCVKYTQTCIESTALNQIANFSAEKTLQRLLQFKQLLVLNDILRCLSSTLLTTD